MSDMEFGLSLVLGITWVCFVLVAWMLSIRITDARDRADNAYRLADAWIQTYGGQHE